MTFYINRPPACDSFAVTPTDGVAFSVAQSPFFYSFSPFDPDETRVLGLMSYQVYRVDLSSQLDVDLTGEVGQTRGNLGALPTGDASNSFLLTVGVRAWDRFRASSTASVQVVAAPPAGGVTLEQLQAYYVAVDSISRDDTQTLMIATSNVMSTLASQYVDTIGAQSSPPLQNFVQFYAAYAPLKKYMVERVLAKQGNLRAGVLADFLAMAMADYSTLDQVTVLSVLQTLQQLMQEADAELWQDVKGDPHVLQSVVYIIQQAFHATAMAYVSGLTEASVPVQPPTGAIYYDLSATTVTNTSSPELMLSTSNAVLSTLLNHLSDVILLPGDVLGLNYNRSLSGVVAKADLASSPLTTITFDAELYWASQVSLNRSAFPAELLDDENAILTITLLQLDGWGDQLSHPSFDIFPTIYLNISAASQAFPTTYPESAVNVSITYDERACDDGWVNAGQFRLYVAPSARHCNLSCAVFDPSTAQFSNASSQVRTVAWDYDGTTITCEVRGPGLYTILKDSLYLNAINDSLPQGIVTAVTTLEGVPTQLTQSLTNFTAQIVSDVSYLLDIPPVRVGAVTAVTASSSNSTWDVSFKILGASDISTQSSYSLMDSLRTSGFLNTSHTRAFRYNLMPSIACLNSDGQRVTGSDCDPGATSQSVTRVEIIAIAVVVGFFGTLCMGVVLFFCCRQLKYWWDRHDFRQTAVDDDTEMAGIGSTDEFGGAKSARERAADNRRRRSGRVSWYNKDVETAASYTYSRNSRPSMSDSGSGKRAAFRVRSDSRGSEDGDLKLDDVEVVGGEGDVNAEDLAEIGLVIDGADDEDSYVMDGHKVKTVKQVKEVDGEELSIDDSAMSRSRGSSLGSREYSQSGGSRNSVGSVNDDAPLALTYSAQEEPSVSRRSEGEPTTPRTPGSGGRKAFIYQK